MNQNPRRPSSTTVRTRTRTRKFKFLLGVETNMRYRSFVYCTHQVLVTVSLRASCPAGLQNAFGRSHVFRYATRMVKMFMAPACSRCHRRGHFWLVQCFSCQCPWPSEAAWAHPRRICFVDHCCDAAQTESRSIGSKRIFVAAGVARCQLDALDEQFAGTERIAAAKRRLEICIAIGDYRCANF